MGVSIDTERPIKEAAAEKQEKQSGHLEEVQHRDIKE